VVRQIELRKWAHDVAIALTKRPAGSLSLTKKLMRDQQSLRGSSRTGSCSRTT
jgi:hypothetical protein